MYSNVCLHLLGCYSVRIVEMLLLTQPLSDPHVTLFVYTISRIGIEPTSFNGCPSRGSGGSEEDRTMPGMLLMILLVHGATYKKTEPKYRTQPLEVPKGSKIIAFLLNHVTCIQPPLGSHQLCQCRGSDNVIDHYLVYTF